MVHSLITESLGLPARYSKDAIDALTERELGRSAHFVARMRLLALPLMATIMILLIFLDPVPWKLWLMGSVIIVAGVILIHDSIWLRNRQFALWHVPYALSAIITFQTIIIAVTGGIESPFLVIYVPVAILPAAVLGRVNRFLLFVLIPISLVWLFALGTAGGVLPELTPSFFGKGIDFGLNPVYTYTKAALYTGIMLLFRATFNRMVQTTAKARYELLETMQERNQELLSLSGSLAHELKNPLASIRGLSELVAKKLPKGSKEAKHMNVLVGEVKRMGAILEEFLNFSRPMTELVLRQVHPKVLLSDVVLMHEGMAHARGVTVSVIPGALNSLSCDPRKVKQILVNLFQNALDATSSGGSITASITEKEGGEALFTIEDNGSGLAEPVRGRLFTPGATTKSAGSGLGLTIARALAEQHGGSLELEERPEGGCRALLSLPLKGCSEQQARIAPQGPLNEVFK